jgi:tRNA(Ile)-lysidine synthase
MIPSSVEALLETGVDLGPDGDMVARFRRDLDALIPHDVRFGVAVSGGPDSVGLLLLAAADRPGKVEAATVDHALRAESPAEARMVEALCERLDVPHTTLTVAWDEKPRTGIQLRARAARYALLGRWAQEKALHSLLTAHQLDDQAETLLMRMVRGAGIKGLAGMRRVARTPGGQVPLVRPLLGWRRAELQQVCASVGVMPVEDPSNEDEQFERVRIRHALAGAEWLDPRALALSAGNLAQADAALDWSARQVWDRLVEEQDKSVSFEPNGVPHEIRRRLIHRAVLKLATEGPGREFRGRELDRLLQLLAKGGKATLRGVLCTGGNIWRFVPAPNRTRPVDNFC